MRFGTSMLLAGATALMLASPAVSARQPGPYSGIVVFGTSLSDSGNAFALLGVNNTPPDYALDPLLVPSAPYARGGHHLSNGPTWIEQLARSWGLAGSVRPAFASDSPTATNYAVGAARAYADGRNFNLGDQVQAFLTDHGGVPPPDALYVIEMGSNDIRDAIAAFQTGGLMAAQQVLAQAVAAIALNMQILHQAGARHFLVWLPPNLALTPAVRALAQVNPAILQVATMLTQTFNTVLDGTLTGLAALPGITVARLNAYVLLNSIVADPQLYALSNVSDACITEVAPFFCQRADEYLFWDGIHPTRAGHALLASAAALALPD